MSERNWSTKTLARQLIAYYRETELKPTDTIAALFAALTVSIVEEEVGVDLDLGE